MNSLSKSFLSPFNGHAYTGRPCTNPTESCVDSKSSFSWRLNVGYLTRRRITPLSETKAADFCAKQGRMYCWLMFLFRGDRTCDIGVISPIIIEGRRCYKRSSTPSPADAISTRAVAAGVNPRQEGVAESNPGWYALEPRLLPLEQTGAVSLHIRCTRTQSLFNASFPL